MSKGKGQQVMEHNSFPLEFQLPDGKDKDILQTAQRCYLFIALIQSSVILHNIIYSIHVVPTIIYIMIEIF